MIIKLVRGGNIKRILNLFTYAFLSIEIILVILFTLPNIFSIKTYVVTSGSMEPKLPVGSLIYVKKVDSNTLTKDDAITFYMENSKIVATHKIYDINTKDNTFITYGINNKDEKGNIIKDVNPVTKDRVIGKVIFCIPYLGYINMYLTTKPGIYIVLIVTILVIGLSYLMENKSKKEVLE